MGYLDSYYYYHPNTLRPAGNMVVGGDGLGTWIPYTMDGLTGSLSGVKAVASDLVTGRPVTTAGLAIDNIWGNFQNYVPDLTDPLHAYGSFTTTGQTAAAEAMNTLTCNYEFLKYAFNRTGIDNKDSAATIYVNSHSWGSNLVYTTFETVGYDANLNPTDVPVFLLRCGTGDPARGVLNTAEPTLMGWGLSIMLWDYTIGNTTASSIRDWMGVERSWATLMSQGIYSLGSLHGINRRVILPSWHFGENYAGGYLASMVKPSLDGISPDYWYDGSYFIGSGESIYSTGPMNRAYYFMAEGASADSTSNRYSDFLPEGMTGIGLEKTCKIAYKAITENLGTPNASVFEMKTALVKAAADLYGDSSPEVLATTNAWAAVNVGAAYGKPEPVKVWFDMHNWPDNTDLGANGPFEPNPRSQRYPWVPVGEPAQLKVNVSGTTDTTVTWTANPAPYSWSGFYDLSTVNNGNITPGGLYTASTRQPTASINVNSIQARSVADAKQWAQGLVYGLAFDDDGDGNNDALDLGMLALAYGLPYPILNSVNDHIMAGFPGVSEGEVQMNLAAFKTAFGN